MTQLAARMWRSAGRRLAAGAPAVAMLLVCASASALDGETVALPKLASDVTAVPFDELMQVEVTSVSKRAEPATAAAAAIFVLTGAEIRRSGVRRIAEALRLVPGLQVAQRSVTSYAISARGFNSTSADKLEVLLDGRSVYTPLTSSVFWDVLDTYLPDIDRIEVIRGPGATLWGANAVNGVINIITKSAAQTQGASGAIYAGNEDPYGASARLGVRLGETGSLRIYSQASSRDSATRADGGDPADDMRMIQTGFRSDWDVNDANSLTIAGDLYRADENVQTIDAMGGSGPVADLDKSGGNVLARWTGGKDDDGRWSVQASYDTYSIVDPTIFTERRKTAAIDFQQQWLIGERNTLVYGAGFKRSRDETGGPPLVILFDPASRALNTYSAFLQDQVSLFEGGTLTIGSKFEHNSLSGFEVQPSIRLGWQASPTVFTWTAVSRAVRTPNRIDQDIAIFCPEPNGFPGVCGPGLSRIGNPNLDSEKLIAYEWGLRWRARDNLALDLATYFNDYTSLRSTEPTTLTGAFDNKMRAHGYGAELSVVWQAADELELRPFYSFLVLDARPDGDSGDVNTAATLEGSNPRHQAGLVASYAFAPNWHLGAFWRYVAALPQTATPSSTSGSTRVPAYTELNLRLARSFGPGLELGLVGRNLVHDSHPENGPQATRSKLERGLFLELRWNWK